MNSKFRYLKDLWGGQMFILDYGDGTEIVTVVHEATPHRKDGQVRVTVKGEDGIRFDIVSHPMYSVELIGCI